MGLEFITFVVLRYIFLFLVSLAFLTLKTLNFVECLFCIDKNDNWYLSLTLFLYRIMRIYLYILNQSCIPQMKSSWWWCMIVSMVFFKFEELYCGNLHIYSSRKFTYSFHCLVFLFLVMVFSIFHFRVMPTL